MDWSKIELSEILTFLAACLVALPGWFAFVRSKRKDKAEATDIITGAATKVIASLETRLANAQTTIDRLEKAIAEAHADLQRTRGDLNTAQDELNQLRRENTTVEDRNRTLVQGVAALTGQLRSHEIEPNWCDPEAT